MLEKCQNCLHAELAPAEHSAMDVEGMGLVMIPQFADTMMNVGVRSRLDSSELR